MILGRKTLISHCHLFVISEYTLESAKYQCNSFGEEWSVAKETSGSIVCSKNRLSWRSNCHRDCDTWRLLVFKSGSDEHGVGSFNTKEGYFYGGHDPCSSDSPHYNCGGGWTPGRSEIYLHKKCVQRYSSVHQDHYSLFLVLSALGKLIAVTEADCPCNDDDYNGCTSLPECSYIMGSNDLCEADQPLPTIFYSGENPDFDVNNCPGGSDVFRYVAGKQYTQRK